MLNVKPVGATTGTHVWHDLNMYIHVLAGPDVSAEKYENAREKYCSFLQSHEDKVENAITSNSLQIRDQLIFKALHNVPGGDVPTLVKELVTESPKRTQGMHVAQPVLCRAGPGTGKTWMIKQSLFLLVENLSSDKAGGGKRGLMPAIVFVQRIVRLLRELGEGPSVLLQDPNGSSGPRISSCTGRVHDKMTKLLGFAASCIPAWRSFGILPVPLVAASLLAVQSSLSVHGSGLAHPVGYLCNSCRPRHGFFAVHLLHYSSAAAVA